MLRIEIVRDVSRLYELRQSWWTLGERLEHWTPFQTPEWLLTWWKHFGSGDLHTFVFTNDLKKVMAIVPCFLHEWEGQRQLTLVGSGISDYLEPAIDPHYRAEVIECLSDYLESNPEWTVCKWQDLSSHTPLGMIGRSNLTVDIEADSPCSEIPLRGNFDDFWAERPRGLRRNVRRYGEKLQRVGAPEFSFTATNDKELLGVLTKLHTARWREQGEPGMIVANKSAEFLCEVVGQLSPGMVAFFSMRLDGRVVAVILSFPFRNVLFSYLSAFDPEYEALGIGRLLLHSALSYSFQHQYATWDFLRGSETYKFDWGAQAVPKTRVIIRRPGDER